MNPLNGNPFGPAIERAKSILAEIKSARTFSDYEGTLVYLTVGSFAIATLISLMGASLFETHDPLLRRLALGLLSGMTGTSRLIAGCGILRWETRIVQRFLLEEADFQFRHVQQISQVIRKRT